MRLKHARVLRGILKDSPDFFTQHIAFYLDGIQFVHKYDPMNKAEKPKPRLWRKKGEGLTVTAKGTKELAGGRRFHLMMTGLNNVCACAQLWRAKIGHDNNLIENGGYFKIL